MTHTLSSVEWANTHVVDLGQVVFGDLPMACAKLTNQSVPTAGPGQLVGGKSGPGLTVSVPSKT